MGGALPALLTPTVDYDVRVARFVLRLPPTEISIFINDSSISELHFSIRSYWTNHKSDQEIFLIARSSAEFSSRSFLFSSLTFLKSCKFPWFLVGIATIVLTHRLQTEDLFIFLSEQIKKVSVVIFQFLVPSHFTFHISNSKFSKIIFRWGKTYPSWLAVIILYLLLLLFSPGLACSSPPPSQLNNCREQQF